MDSLSLSLFKIRFSPFQNRSEIIKSLIQYPWDIVDFLVYKQQQVLVFASIVLFSAATVTVNTFFMQEFRLYANYIKRRIIIKKNNSDEALCKQSSWVYTDVYTNHSFWGEGGRGHNPTERKLWKILNR